MELLSAPLPGFGFAGRNSYTSDVWTAASARAEREMQQSTLAGSDPPRVAAVGERPHHVADARSRP
jgi:hypothetical protein